MSKKKEVIKIIGLSLALIASVGACVGVVRWTKKNGVQEVLPEECLHEKVLYTEGVEVTCTEDGVSPESICAYCGVTVYESITIPALGHEDLDLDGSCDLCEEVMNEGRYMLTRIASYPDVVEEDIEDGGTYAAGTVIRLYNMGDISNPGVNASPDFVCTEVSIFDSGLPYVVYSDNYRDGNLMPLSWGWGSRAEVEGDFYWRYGENYVDVYVGKCSIVGFNYSGTQYYSNINRNFVLTLVDGYAADVKIVRLPDGVQ